MLEVALTALFVTVAVVTIGHRRQRPLLERGNGEVLRFVEEEGGVPDLPCPWCKAQTHEADRSCPQCGQPFG